MHKRGDARQLQRWMVPERVLLVLPDSSCAHLQAPQWLWKGCCPCMLACTCITYLPDLHAWSADVYHAPARNVPQLSLSLSSTTKHAPMRQEESPRQVSNTLLLLNERGLRTLLTLRDSYPSQTGKCSCKQRRTWTSRRVPPASAILLRAGSKQRAQSGHHGAPGKTFVHAQPK